MFEAFWRATGERPFRVLTARCVEVYRLTIETSRADHRVYRVERSGAGVTTFVAHFFVCGPRPEEPSAATHEIALDEPLWRALEVLLAVGRFWELPEEDSRCGLDGAIFTLEGWKADRSHRVVRWSPSPIFSGGELLAVVTDYLERLGELAILECDREIRMRYVPEYVPKRLRVPRGNTG
jgi:hypothetical protein